MEYSGHTEVGGAPEVRVLGSLKITKVAVGPMDNNAYLLTCRDSGEQLLIDAANDAATILTLIGDTGLARIVTTHQHGDHWQALAEVVTKTGAETVAGERDVSGMPVPIDVPVSDGDRIRAGSCELEVINLVGHTPGSIALVYDDPYGISHVFTGDSLFPGGPGRTTRSEDFISLMDGLEAKVFDRFPDDTWIYPGHGDDTTLDAERPNLPAWRDRGW